MRTAPREGTPKPERVVSVSLLRPPAQRRGLGVRSFPNVIFSIEQQNETVKNSKIPIHTEKSAFAARPPACI
jgi:hypothetical protein